MDGWQSEGERGEVVFYRERMSFFLFVLRL